MATFRAIHRIDIQPPKRTPKRQIVFVVEDRSFQNWEELDETNTAIKEMLDTVNRWVDSVTEIRFVEEEV